jgi:alginate O-acetyltransferase complex protein AlgI
VDYVFIPLGGSRKSPPRVYLNVLITMFLSGLWHGAGLNFVVWGLWHGLLLAGHRLWSNWRESSVMAGALGTARSTSALEVGRAVPSAPLFGKIASGLLTFVLVNLGWAFFCMDLPTSLFFFKRLFLG